MAGISDLVAERSGLPSSGARIYGEIQNADGIWVPTRILWTGDGGGSGGALTDTQSAILSALVGGSANQLIRRNSANTGLEYFTLAGSDIVALLAALTGSARLNYSALQGTHPHRRERSS